MHRGWTSRAAAFLAARFEVAQRGQRQILSMEGLRGLAVFLVFWVHYAGQFTPWIAPESLTAHLSTAFAGVGNAGVDLFFVLSGYLIYGSLIRKEVDLGKYFARRVERIYPTFLAVFAIYLLLSVVFPAESKLPHGFGPAMAMLAENLLLLPGIFNIPAIITVSWSLSYELFYYLAIPLVIGALGLRGWPVRRRVVLFLVAAAGILAYSALYGGHVRLVMFIAGIVLYETPRREWPRWIGAAGLAALALALVTIHLLDVERIPGPLRYVVLFAAFYLLTLSCFSERGAASRLFSIAPVRWLGNMSYSYYLIHGLTLKAFFLLFAVVHPPFAGESALFWVIFPVAFALTLLPSAALYLMVERPFSLERSRSLATGFRRVPAPLPAAGGLSPAD